MLSKSRGLLAFLLVGFVGSVASARLEGAQLRGTVSIDGSSTVFLISEAVAEEFAAKEPRVRVPVGFSGTGGGFKKFANREIDICDASRKIKESEVKACKKAGVEFIEVEVAYDGLAVIAHPENHWIDSLTVEQLKMIWRPASIVKRWSDLDPSWPNEPIKFYSPGADSGTFDYFTEAICGETKACRSDATFSEDDNVLVTGVSQDKYSLGYFGLAYFAENRDKLKLIAVDGGKGPVKPTTKTVMSGKYSPLSRPLFIYVSKASLARPEVRAFVKFYLKQAPELSSEVGYVPLSKEAMAKSRALIK